MTHGRRRKVNHEGRARQDRTGYDNTEAAARGIRERRKPSATICPGGCGLNLDAFTSRRELREHADACQGLAERPKRGAK